MSSNSILQTSFNTLRHIFVASIRLPRLLLIITCCSLFTLFSVGCGKRRPPLPPVERVPQRTELLAGAQRGNQVLLSFPAPRRNAADDSVQSIRRIDVYRLAEALNAPLPLTEEEFGGRATLVGSIPEEEILAGRDTLTYTDRLELAGEPVRLRYALRYVNNFGGRAAFSNFLLIEPAQSVSLPPELASVTNETELAIRLRWNAPVSNLDNSRPPNVLGYNIYRQTSAQDVPAQTPLNQTPVTQTQFDDSTFEFGTEYTYIVRAVSLGTGGAQVESLNSNAVSVSPRDTFAPSAPTSVTVAAAPNRLSLFFPANPERDVSGYIVFRSTDPNLPKEQWTRLTREPITRTTFQDETVESGKRYYYYLVAIDRAGNISRPSEVVSEVVP